MPRTNLVFCEAPTSRAPTLCLGAPTPRTSILQILRHQPQGIQPYLFKTTTPRAPTLSCQGTNLGFRSTKSKDTNPSNSEAPTPRDLTLSCQDMFGSNFILPKFSSLSSVNLQLHCSLHATSSMTTLPHRRCHQFSSLYPTTFSMVTS